MRSMAVVIDNGRDVIDVAVEGQCVDGNGEKKRHADRQPLERRCIGVRSDDDAMIVEEANSCERGCKEQIKINIST